MNATTNMYNMLDNLGGQIRDYIAGLPYPVRFLLCHTLAFVLGFIQLVGIVIVAILTLVVDSIVHACAAVIAMAVLGANLLEGELLVLAQPTPRRDDKKKNDFNSTSLFKVGLAIYALAEKGIGLVRRCIAYLEDKWIKITELCAAWTATPVEKSAGKGDLRNFLIVDELLMDADTQAKFYGLDMFDLIAGANTSESQSATDKKNQVLMVFVGFQPSFKVDHLARRETIGRIQLDRGNRGKVDVYIDQQPGDSHTFYTWLVEQAKGRKVLLGNHWEWWN